MDGVTVAPTSSCILHAGRPVDISADPVLCRCQMNLLELAKEVQKEQALHDVGGDEATLATVPGALRVRCQEEANSGHPRTPAVT